MGIESDSEFQRWIHSLSLSELCNALAFTFISDTSDGANHNEKQDFSNFLSNPKFSSGSHEFDLLIEMIQSQVPLPTPIHPRAIHFTEATRTRPTDGRNSCQNYKRMLRDRFYRPRLFQLVENENFSSSATASTKKKSRKKANLKKQSTRYLVLAKKFSLASGDILNVDCSTFDQIESEKEIITNTVLYHCSLDNRYHCRFNGCSKSFTAQKVLRMFHLASKGKFLRSSWVSMNEQNNLLFAPWFSVDEWFSLPCYLVSRFELSLMKRYCNFRKCQSVLPVHNPSNTLIEHYKDIPVKKMVALLLESIYAAMARYLRNIRENLREDQFFIRDNVLFTLCSDRELSKMHYSPPSIKSMLEWIMSIPLLQYGCSYYSTLEMRKIKKISFQILQEKLSYAMEQNILCLDTTLTIAPQKSLSNRKKKKKKKKQNNASTLKDYNNIESTNNLQRENDNFANSKRNEEDDDEDWLITNSSQSFSSKKLQRSEEAPPKQNENSIIVLLVLDDIIHNACQELGLIQDVSSSQNVNEYSNNIVEQGWKMCKATSTVNIHSSSVSRTKGKQKKFLESPRSKYSKNKNSHEYSTKSLPNIKKNDRNPCRVQDKKSYLHKERYVSLENNITSKERDTVGPKKHDNILWNNSKTLKSSKRQPEVQPVNSVFAKTDDEKLKENEDSSRIKKWSDVVSSTQGVMGDISKNHQQTTAYDINFPKVSSAPNKEKRSEMIVSQEQKSCSDDENQKQLRSSSLSSIRSNASKSFSPGVICNYNIKPSPLFFYNNVGSEFYQDSYISGSPFTPFSRNENDIPNYSNFHSYQSASFLREALPPPPPPPTSPSCFIGMASSNIDMALIGNNDITHPQQYREKSMFAELFFENKEKVALNRNNETQYSSESQQIVPPSSTCASIASSPTIGSRENYDDVTSFVCGENESSQENELLLDIQDIKSNDSFKPSSELERGVSDSSFQYEDKSNIGSAIQNNAIRPITSSTPSSLSVFEVNTSSVTRDEDEQIGSYSSPLLPAPPSTPPPQLSPLLVSLADLSTSKSRETSFALKNRKKVGSVPNSPVGNNSNNRYKEAAIRRPTATFRPIRSKEHVTREYSLQGKKETYLQDSPKQELTESALNRHILHNNLKKTRADELMGSREGNNSTSMNLKKSTLLRTLSSLSFDLNAATPTNDHGNIQNSFKGKNSKDIIDHQQRSTATDCAVSVSAVEENAISDEQQRTNGDYRSGELNVELSRETQYNVEIGSDTKGRVKDIPMRSEDEDITLLREERNGYRDMCLTLSAEVSKLKNMLSCASMSHFTAAPPFHYFGSSSDPELMPPFYHQSSFQNNAYNHNFARIINTAHDGVMRTTSYAMSDIGISQRQFDHESIRSEDGCTDTTVATFVQGSCSITDNSTGLPRWIGNNNNSVTRMHNYGSDCAASSIDNNNIGGGSFVIVDRGNASSFRSNSIRSNSYKDPFWLAPVCHGLQSRLSNDLRCFLESTYSKLHALDFKRTTAIKRISQVVTALWPRAQVKLYGSHVTKLCLPSSDLDFIICLPAVHKNAPAVAPGVLEGRNAINETWQKILARKLKGESWLDPRSIKLIERTIVPIIKVSTKDSRANVLRLDISFDGPDHHGLEAVNMVTHIMDELPMVRPLVLVLKQFLLDRGLLTAFSGGLSSYCLFLMVTRFLQEQPASYGDPGSLLLGFLDFFGNQFDPRATGISIRRKEYFSRHNYDQVAIQSQQQHQFHHSELHSVAEKGNQDFQSFNNYKEPYSTKPLRIQNRLNHAKFYSQPATNASASTPTVSSSQSLNYIQSGRPYKFDPLFVEDPLSVGNNVGRNAFRIFQVKRAFSDAHSAIMASLDWDIGSDLNYDNDDYPLLKCLLNSDEAFHGIDSIRD